MSPQQQRQNTSGETITMPSTWMLCCMGLSALSLYMIVNHVGFATLEKMTSESHKDAVQEPAPQSFELATHESLGFFTDISDEAWLLRKKINHRTRHHALDEGYEEPMMTPRAWYQNNWNEDFSCFHEVGVGGIADGHKFVCDPHRFEEDCLVYSFGSNNQFDFELALNELAPNCEIHIFDPTDYGQQMLQAGVKATYHAWGLTGSYEATNSAQTVRDVLREAVAKRDGVEYKTLQETLVELGHVGRRIDVFKIDCEGCEWRTYRDWIIHSDVDIRQIEVEVHGFPPNTNQFFQDLYDQNYVIFHKEPNIEFSGGDCVEFSFLKLHGDFFEQDEE